MNRKITNTIRFVMDEMIPPFIRDSKWFMYPFFWLAYRGKNINKMMDFKKNVYQMTSEEYANLYNDLNSISRNRKTDLNQVSIDFILKQIEAGCFKNIIDIGCGSGYILDLIQSKFPHIELTGIDIKKSKTVENYNFVEGNLEKLPFENNSFDLVLCNHTVEHLVDLNLCISELVRITNKKLVVVTPCQRPYYYTLDEHVNFFQFKEQLIALFPFIKYECKSLQGDWGYVGEKE
ncbi:MAG: class I SAM-dependent methyltransferase [Crocinitomicaceae bacterium]